MLEVDANDLGTRYRVEVWSEYLGRWIPADIEGASVADVLAGVQAALRDHSEDDRLADPDNRRIVECRETVIPWPDGASDGD